jgi:hypothetical protein
MTQLKLTWWTICVAGLVVAAASYGHAQTARGRLLRIVPDSAGATRDWDNALDQMIRSNELLGRMRRDDTLIGGRAVEQFVQYYKGVRVWGGSVSRQLDAGRAVSIFGTLYQGLDIDVTPALDREAATIRLENVGGYSSARNRPELVILPDDNGASGLLDGDEFTRAPMSFGSFIDANTERSSGATACSSGKRRRHARPRHRRAGR